MRKYLIIAILLIAYSFGFCQKHFVRDSTDVMTRANAFVSAFNHFKWEEFRNFFSDDASMFHPQAENKERITGKNEIEARWLKIFPQFADTANKQVMKITASGIHVQIYDKTAIVSFHLPGDTNFGRRSIVWVKQKGVWKIVHLHASNLR